MIAVDVKSGLYDLITLHFFTFIKKKTSFFMENLHVHYKIVLFNACGTKY